MLGPEKKTGGASGSWTRNEPAKTRPVRVAKPGKGPVDFKALRASIMKRFEKTLAYLAK